MLHKNFKIRHALNQRGSILLFSVMILGFILIISFSVMTLLIPRLGIIRDSSSSVAAIYAADSALEWCIYESRYAGNLNSPSMSAIWGSSRPTYTITDLTAPVPGDICPLDQTLSHRAVGTYRGVTRALELF